MNWQEEYKRRLCSAEEAVQHIHSGDTVFLGHAVAESSLLVDAMVQNATAYQDVRIIHMTNLGSGAYTQPRLLHDLNVGMVVRLALDSRPSSGMPCKRASEVFRSYDAEFLDMLEHCGVDLFGLGALLARGCEIIHPGTRTRL